MTDIAALPKCPHGKKGRHNAMLYVAEGHDEDDEKVAVWACGPCGAMRIVPLSLISDPPLDEMGADEILRRTKREPDDTIHGLASWTA